MQEVLEKGDRNETAMACTGVKANRRSEMGENVECGHSIGRRATEQGF